MAKSKSQFTCQECGYSSPRWLGRCPECGGWSTLVEEEASRGARSSPGGTQAIPLTEVRADKAARTSTGVGELDRVLGGGIVPGSLVLLGGDPGVGKSTLLLQALDGTARAGAKVLYVSGEESLEQTALRAARLGSRSPSLMVLAETRLERILDEAMRLQPAVLAVDSVQTVQVGDAGGLGAPVAGSLGAVRAAAARLLAFAKEKQVATILVGHVTKDGALAGPKTLEHVVDTVLHFEGERGASYRILRAAKNRFGSTNEVGVFEMGAEGLREVPNPSALFLAERPTGLPGSSVIASIEGSRPLLVEVQALVATAAGVPRRATLGFDPNRVALLLAVIERRAGIDVLGQDVFVNVAGGVRLGEPAADLGVIAAVASSARRRAVEPRTLCFGEVGLAGEVRAVSQPELRLAEAAKLGFRRCVMPEVNRARLADKPPLEVVGVRDVEAALAALVA